MKEKFLRFMLVGLVGGLAMAVAPVPSANNAIMPAPKLENDSYYAKTQDITFLDIGPQLLQPDGSLSTEIMNDGVHPTEKGYAIWAEALRPLLK